MIFFDVTKMGAARHRSGLMRVSARLREELGAAVRPTSWPFLSNEVRTDDWLVTGELFSELDRPGFGEFLKGRSCHTAAIFADAIPLTHPHITWPQSVARHPGYMKALASFERIFAISDASRDELRNYWQWLGVKSPPPVQVLPLGSDFKRGPRVIQQPPLPAPGSSPLSLVCVGILEPRKNQMLLLEVCEALWSEGLTFELHIVGRVNPYFGKPIVGRIKSLRKRFPGLRYHAAIPDAELAQLYATARATVFPTIAEGCGLPLLESLWHGAPCLCSDLPVLHENADTGGCITVPVNDRTAWKSALNRLLTDDAEWTRLAQEAKTRPLPTWAEAAKSLREGLK